MNVVSLKSGLSALIKERMSKFATSLPPAALAEIEAEVCQQVFHYCPRIVDRTITSVRLARAVANALAASAGQDEGRKGGTPLPSSVRRDSAEHVACRTPQTTICKGVEHED